MVLNFVLRQRANGENRWVGASHDRAHAPAWALPLRLASLQAEPGCPSLLCKQNGALHIHRGLGSAAGGRPSGGGSRAAAFRPLEAAPAPRQHQGYVVLQLSAVDDPTEDMQQHLLHLAGSAVL